MKKVLVSLFLFYSVSSIAGPTQKSILCNNINKIKEGAGFSNIFERTHHMMKYGYQTLYDYVDKDFSENLRTFCNSNHTKTQLFRACPVSCSNGITRFDFFSFWGVKKKERELFNECALVCQINEMYINGFIEAAVNLPSK